MKFYSGLFVTGMIENRPFAVFVYEPTAWLNRKKMLL